METITKTKLSAKTKAIIAVALLGTVGLAFAGFVALKTTYGAWRQTAKQDFSLGKTTNTVITEDGRIHLQKLQTEKRKIKYITSGSFTTCALFTDDTIQCVFNGDPSGVKNFGKIEGAKSINTNSLLVTKNIDDVRVVVLLENGELKYTDENGAYQDKCCFVDGADLGSVKQLTPNVMHQCVLLDDGHVACWGDNGQNQLGAGPDYSMYPKFTLPILAKDVENASYVGVGLGGTCAVLTNGKVKCWGAFGDNKGNVVKLSIPTEIKNITNASAVTITNVAVFALLNDGTVKYWDDGYGDNIKSLGLTGVKAISAGGWGGGIGSSAGYYAACALLSDNTAKCWGNNMVIEKMAGKKVGITETPIDITDGQGKKTQNISAISIGGYNICTLLTDGSGKCWGGDGPLEANVWPPEEWFDNKYMTSGEYVSMPKTVKGIIKPNFYQAQWAAGEQDGVSLKLQVRTSSTENGLMAAQWYDLDGTKISSGVFKDGWTEDFYPGWGLVNKWAPIKPPAKSWIQYKVIFSTNDNTKSPTLSKINIDYKGIIDYKYYMYKGIKIVPKK